MAEEEREEWAKASAEDATAAKKATIDEEIFIVLFVFVVRFGFGVGENKKLCFCVFGLGFFCAGKFNLLSPRIFRLQV
jgi:hypothetical protein